jgi:hypothetical protein
LSPADSFEKGIDSSGLKPLAIQVAYGMSKLMPFPSGPELELFRSL